jgi:FixJ family two-component response regulator
VKRERNEVNVIALLSRPKCRDLARQLEALDIRLICLESAADVVRAIEGQETFEVAIVPATLPDAEWWPLWGELCLLNPRPAILVYSQTVPFQLWSGVLEAGGYDVIPEPFSDREIQQAILRAARSFRQRS